MLSNYDKSPLSYNSLTGRFETNKENVGIGDIINVSRLSFVFEKSSDDSYYIYSYESNGYLTITDNGEVTSLAKDTHNSKQLFRIKRVGLKLYKISCYNGNLLSLNEDGLNNMYIYPDVKHIKQ